MTQHRSSFSRRPIHCRPGQMELEPQLTPIANSLIDLRHPEWPEDTDERFDVYVDKQGVTPADARRMLGIPHDERTFAMSQSNPVGSVALTAKAFVNVSK